MSLVFEALQRLEGNRTGLGLLPSLEPADLFRQTEHLAVSKWEAAQSDSTDDSERPVVVPKVRPVGTPLQMGGSRPVTAPELSSALTIQEAQVETDHPDAPLSDAPSGEGPSSQAFPAVQHAIEVLCGALPSFVQRIMPLFDGSAFTSFGPQQQLLTSTSLPAPLNLVSVEGHLVELKTQHSNLREYVAEQNLSIQRTEEKLHAVRQATERNTLEQQELIEELRGVGTKVNVVAAIAFGMLTISIIVDILLFMHMPRFVH